MLDTWHPRAVRTFISAILVFGVLAAAAHADLTGIPRIIDGDTIEVAGQRVRLHGIDAPESRQTCPADGKPWQCGKDATAALKHMVGTNQVTCVERDRDRYGRVVAVCHAGDVNLNARMVRDGWALADRRYSADYVADESTAGDARTGLWRGQFVPPWKWRRGERLQ